MIEVGGRHDAGSGPVPVQRRGRGHGSPGRRGLLAGLVALLLAASCAADESPEADEVATEDAVEEDVVGEEDAADEDATAAGAPVASAGCGSSDIGAVDREERTLTVGGDERWYLLTTPDEHDGVEPLPVVVSFHGLMEGAQVHSNMSGYGELGQQEGFVAVFPNGTGEPVHWNVHPDEEENPDVPFVDAMLDDLGEALCIDESRIYVSGLSNGAMMTSTMACLRADRFAAFAPVAGVADPDPCEPARPVPMLAFHGTDDQILRFDGSIGAIPGLDDDPADGTADDTDEADDPAEVDLHGEGYPATVAAWAARNGCAPEASDEEVTDEVIHRTFDCPDDAPVEFHIVVGGGHSWPGSEFSESIGEVVGHTTFDIDASAVAWEFFQRFQLP